MRDWLTALFGRKWDDAVAHEVVHPEVRGKKFKNVMDSRLRPIRVRIAHSVLDESEPGPAHLSKIRYWLPLTQCFARQMMKNEFADL
jgi:hypothetical protein